MTLQKSSFTFALLAMFLSGCSSAPGLRVSWKKNYLRISGPGLGTDGVEVLYLEAYCRRGSTDREWGETTIPHRTEKIEASADGTFLRLRCQIEGNVEVVHEIRAGTNDVDFNVVATNHGSEHVDAHWAQPCMRIGEFTGRNRQGHVMRGEEDYTEKCFIFVDGNLTRLHRTRRESEARYRGGQVYVPDGVDRNDVNPRPLSPDVPSNGIIGCFSADDGKILAMVWDPYQELFQGVILCIHADFRLGGLAPGETKTARGKIYVVDNDVDRLLEMYRRDFATP